MARKLLPDSTYVFGRKVKIGEVRDLRDSDGNGADGLYHPDTKEIEIDIELDRESKMVAYVHELGHAMFDRLFSSSSINSDMQEMIVDNFAVLINENFRLTIKRERKNEKKDHKDPDIL